MSVSHTNCFSIIKIMITVTAWNFRNMWDVLDNLPYKHQIRVTQCDTDVQLIQYLYINLGYID